MIVHACHIHPQDAWCAEFHVRAYLTFCDVVVVMVDGPQEYADSLVAIDPGRVVAFSYRTGEGAEPDLGPIRRAALDMAIAFHPALIVFGDADEVPTPDVATWARTVADRPRAGERWYAHWVNLWGDYRHAIGGASAWSYQSPRGNKKCLAMQPGGDLAYAPGWHGGMEPGRPGGGRAPVGPTHHMVESPKLLHLKYASAIYPSRPESKLARHQPAEMLKGGEIVGVPAEWLWEGMPK